MKKTKQINIYVGLKQSDMKTDVNKDELLKVVTEKLQQIGQVAFSYSYINGMWEGQPEETLKVSFLNTENILLSAIEHKVNYLRGHFKQECILLEVLDAEYKFIGD